MIRLSVIAVLLAVECGYRYAITPDPVLSIEQYDTASGFKDGVRFRLEAGCINSGCGIHVDILNLRQTPLAVAPHDASIEMKCGHYDDVRYWQGGGVSSFQELEEKAWKRNSLPYWTEAVIDEPLVLPPRGFVQLEYGSWSRLNHCAPITFELPINGGPTISAKFLENPR